MTNENVSSFGERQQLIAALEEYFTEYATGVDVRYHLEQLIKALKEQEIHENQ